MMYRKLTRLIFLFAFCLSFSQNELLSVYGISDKLKNNANASIRNYNLEVVLNSYSSMTVKSSKIITIFNEDGMKHLDPYVYYDGDIKVKSIEARVYDAFGNEINKFRRNDFKDFSNSGGNLFSDNRVLALDYTPVSYPFTFKFEYEFYTESTAFFQPWYPIDNYNLSTENSFFKIINTEGIPLDVNEYNLGGTGIENLSYGNTIQYKAKDLSAVKWEVLSPSLQNVIPFVKVAPQKFRLVNVDGEAKTWDEFGKWNYENLIKGRNSLPQETIQKVNKMLNGIEDPIEKAKVIYKYVQDNTRYVSIQLGVGGWQPIEASRVDDVKYGDCKALTNYTKALLDSQGITSYYTVVYGDSDIRDIQSNFIGMQGNHVILNIPNNHENIWLECTSQTTPFGHIANFTDDRNVFVITPEGGRIERTKAYTSKENYLKANASITFDEHGGFKGQFNSKSGGTQYSYRNRIVEMDHKDRDLFYKNNWKYINDLAVLKMDHFNNYDDAEMNETVTVEARSYVVAAGERWLIIPNVFNRYYSQLPRYSNRQLPFRIQRGFLDEDEYELEMPIGWSIESLPKPEEIKSKFGTYSYSIEKLSDSKIRYKRSLEIVKGSFEKDEYNDYRTFRRAIAKSDKAVIALRKSE